MPTRTTIAAPAAGLGVAAHLEIALAFTGVAVAALVITLLLLGRAAYAPQRTGALLAFFPPQWAAEARLVAAAGAGAVVRGEGRLPGLVEVVSEEPGLAFRLRAAGAFFVMVPLPADALTQGACIGIGLLPARPTRVRAVPL